MALTTVPASLSATALTLTTAAQPNITSVGTLTGLTVSGNIAGTLTTAAQTNITSLGTLTGLTVSGNLIVDTTTLVVDATNNRVGAGVASPQSNMHVLGTLKVATGNAQGILGLGEGAGTTVNVGLWRGAANNPTSDGNFLNLGGYDGIVFAASAAAIGSQTERMRIDSSGNLLVGTTTHRNFSGDTTEITVGTTATGATKGGAVTFGSGSGFLGYLAFQESEGTLGTLTSVPLVFKTGNTERMRLTAAGILQLAGGGNDNVGEINFGNTAQNANRLQIRHQSSAWILKTVDSEPLLFGTSNQTKATILANGTFLVGKTADDNSVGFKTNTSSTYMVSSGATPTFINRLSSAGDLIEFRKDSATKGRIGTDGSDIYIGSDDCNLFFFTNAVLPVNSVGGGRDDALNLGAHDTRFKNLFLSEGVYLGGTGAANKLDDYEEGSWTPTITGNSGASGQSYNVQLGKYTKIGSFVHYTFDVSLTTAGTFSGSYVVIGGLPFPGNGANIGGSVNIGYHTGIGGNLPLGGYISGSNVYLMEHGTSGSDYMLVSENKIGNSGRLIGSLLVYTPN